MRLGRRVSLAVLVPGPAALDGGLATELEARGYDLAHHLWSAQLLASDPDAIRDLHLDYYRCGARVATSASYQASRRGFLASGMDADEADSLLVRSVQLAQQARDLALAEGVPGPLLVAASVGPYGAIRHDGSEYRGHYDVPRAELVAFHAERLDVLAAAGPDLLAVETIPDVAEAEVVAGLLDQYTCRPGCRSHATSGARTCAGQPYADAVAVAVSAARTVAVGVNCSAPQDLAALLEAGRTATDLPFVVYPNAGGVWDAESGDMPDQVAEQLPLVRSWVGAGALLVGGCCGLGPDAVSGIATALAA